MQWLQDFLCLAETGNFSRSADIRATTQPAFSRRIKALEAWLSSALIDRSKTPVGLTAAGELFLPVAQETLQRLHRCKEQLKQETQHEQAIVFSATHTLSSQFFPRWMIKVEKQFGGTGSRLESDHLDSCIESLINGRSHFLFCHCHPQVPLAVDSNHFTSAQVGEDCLIPVCVAKDDKTAKWSLPGTVDSPVPLLKYQSSSGIGRVVNQLCQSLQQPLYTEVVFESYLVGVLKQMCLEGLGVAWLPKQQVQQELDSGRLILACEANESSAKYRFPVAIRLYRANELLSKRAEALWQFIHRSD